MFSNTEYINPKFLYYLFQSFKDNLSKEKNSNKNKVNKYIPIKLKASFFKIIRTLQDNFSVIILRYTCI